jgi:hypothetical protein
VGILSEFDETQCILWLAYALDERGSVPITKQENFLFPARTFSVARHALNLLRNGGPFCVDSHSEVEVNGTSLSSAVAENAWRYTSTAQQLTTIFTLS